MKYLLFATVLLMAGSANALWIDTHYSDFQQGSYDAEVYISRRLQQETNPSDSGCIEYHAKFDVNNDGWYDLVSPSEAGPYLKVWLGSASGYSASNFLSYPITSGGDCDISDLNLDGYPELIHSGYFMRNACIYWGTPSGPSATDTTLLPNDGGEAVYAADVDKDTYIDVVVAGCDNHVYIYWGGPSGYSASNRTAISVGHLAHNIEASDLDKNGYLDLVFIEWEPPRNVVILYQTAARTFSMTQLAYSNTGAGHGLSIGDFDDNGYVDIVATGWSSAKHSYVYLNSPSGFIDANKQKLNPGECYGGSAVADFDDDGRLDILYFRGPNARPLIYFNSGGDPLFSDSDTQSVAKPIFPSGGTVADFNYDGHVDLFFNNQANYSYVFYGPSFTSYDSLPVNVDHHGIFREPKQIPSYYSRVVRVCDSGADTVLAGGMVSWIASTPGDSKINIFIRTGDTPVPDSFWTDWYQVQTNSNSGSLPPEVCGMFNYMQYRADLVWSNPAEQPNLEQVEVDVVCGRANQAPFCDAGGPYPAECAGPGGTEVMLDGAQCSDPDEDSLSYFWSAPGVVFDDPTSPAPTGTFLLGTTDITLVVSDGELADTCFTNVEVRDTTTPTIMCPPDDTLSANEKCEATYEGPGATASDLCDSEVRINSYPPLPVTFSGVGTYTITWIAADGSGNADTCVQRMTIADVTAPVIACPPDTTLKVNGGCEATYGGPPATAVDNCDRRPTITSIPRLPARLTGVGDHTITWIATDASGNADTCYQTIKLIDVIAPPITCPPDTVLRADKNCQATYSGPPATATDNCDASPKITSAPPLPATFTGVGTYTITWTAKDASGNKSTCDQKITVIDAIPPTITCPRDTTMKADGNCQVTYSAPPATATDNCDAKPTIKSVPPLPATLTGVGTYTITWTATDASGNKSTCEQRITVIDVTAPVITCPRDRTIRLDLNETIKCEVMYSGPLAKATDNCDANPRITSVPPVPAILSGAGVHTIVWTATDASGNESSCEQKITLLDLIPPAITCPRDTSIEADADCQATYSGPAAIAVDNCDGNPKVASDPPLPATFIGVGSYTIKWVATDSSGNGDSCYQAVTVIDVTPPAITCPKDTVLQGDSDCEAVYSSPSATAVDNCDRRPVITSSPALPATLKGAGRHTIVYTATDASGNNSSCTQTLTILDVTPPVIICPPDTAIAASGLDCSVTYSGPSAAAFDACDGSLTVTSDPSLPATFNTIGEHEIAFTAVDASGNSSTCRMTVTVSMTSYCMKNEVIPRLQALLPTGEKKVDEKIEKAIESLWHSLNVDPKHPGKPWKKEPLWLNATHLDPKHGEPVFEEEEKVAKNLDEAMKEKKCPPEIKDDLLAAIFSVVSCDQMLARVQIDDAKKAGGDPKEIEKAEKEMVKAKEKWDKGEYEQAVEHYENAWLHAIKAMGKDLLAGGQSAMAETLPYTFALSQNNPNPFSRTTSIQFTLPISGYTTLDIYDVTGRIVATLVDGEVQAGVHSVVWDRKDAASGVYFYRLESGERSLTKKMVVLR
jgi:hypothetical protein